MSILAWIVLGLVAGWVASMIMRTNAQQGVFLDIVMGILGALAGGFLMNLAGGEGVTGLNIWSLAVATLGAIALIWARKTLV